MQSPESPIIGIPWIEGGIVREVCKGSDNIIGLSIFNQWVRPELSQDFVNVDGSGDS